MSLQSRILEHIANHRGVDATQIAGSLYQGAAPPTGRALRDHGFDLLVLCAEEYQLRDALKFHNIHVLCCPMDDSELSEDEWSRAMHCAHQVKNALKQGHKVLVTCAQGRNRSGLVTALALHLYYQMPGSWAIKLIRSLRDGALSNPSFVDALAALS